MKKQAEIRLEKKAYDRKAPLGLPRTAGRGARILVEKIQ
jgi:hypothetical protein